MLNACAAGRHLLVQAPANALQQNWTSAGPLLEHPINSLSTHRLQDSVGIMTYYPG